MNSNVHVSLYRVFFFFFFFIDDFSPLLEENDELADWRCRADLCTL